MDPYWHTLLAVGCIAIAFYCGKYYTKIQILEEIVDNTLDTLEEEGFIRARLNSEGVRELIPISEISNKVKKST